MATEVHCKTRMAMIVWRVCEAYTSSSASKSDYTRTSDLSSILRTWCSSAKRENISLIHLLRGLTRVTYTTNKSHSVSLYLRPHSQQYHLNVTEIFNSRFALENRYDLSFYTPYILTSDLTYSVTRPYEDVFYVYSAFERVMFERKSRILLSSFTITFIVPTDS